MIEDAMTTSAVRFTYADYVNLPEESHHEILDGDLLMSPSPSTLHQRVVLRVLEIVSAWAKSTHAGEAFVAPLDVVLSEMDVVQPDVLFVASGRSEIVKERGVFGAPDLVVEVLSKATAERDRTVKAKLYARAGVKELWLVDPDAKTIEVLVNGPEGFTPQSIARGDEAVRSNVAPGLIATPAHLFA
jgi:Uma2 family endonuclease